MVLKNLKGVGFFICLTPFLLVACSGIRDTKESKESISVIWKDSRAVAITIPRRYVYDTADDSLKVLLTVHLKGTTNGPSILGEYFITDELVRFEPLIPFTRRLEYEVRMRGISIGEVAIPPPSEDQAAPALLGIFPTQDTLPQNLLKFYFRFSKPMREGQSLQHIFLLKNKSDTVERVFLDLQPELWNEDRTMLTLWLDPGRIKRDLQPNKALGEPLQQHINYQLVVSNTWTDIHGTLLKAVVRKNFTVSSRDTLSPAPRQWSLITPAAGERSALKINFHENLDFALLNSAINVLDEKGNDVPGEVKLENEESVYEFFPKAVWISGVYTIRCESRLEDLSGNNLNRPFDRDISRMSKNSEQNFFFLKFNVK
jgi:hypothetical protein